MANPASTADEAWLEMPDGHAQRIGRGCVLGRLGSCDVVLGDEGVSRQHARIARMGKSGHAISDLGSTNGTYVNGLKIAKPTLLRDRDTIGLGTCRLQFRTGQGVSELVTAAAPLAPPAPRRRVLVVADDALSGEGLVRLIDGQHGLVVAGHASDTRQVLALRARTQAEAILLDASGEGAGALSLLSDLLSADPEARIAAILARPDPDFIERVLRRGALACVLKADPPEELVRALQSVLAGSVYLSRRVAAVTVRQLAGSREAGRRAGPQGLTDRELEIFHLVAAARPNREIAVALGMSVKTVETHKENIKIKLGAATAAELAERARDWLSGRDSAAHTPLS